MGQALIGAALIVSCGACRVAGPRKSEGNLLDSAEQTPRLHNNNSYKLSNLIENVSIRRVEIVCYHDRKPSVFDANIVGWRGPLIPPSRYLHLGEIGGMPVSGGVIEPRKLAEIERRVQELHGPGDYLVGIDPRPESQDRNNVVVLREVSKDSTLR